jgi:poly(hydroxyalkanoate) depolymerase family esterase
MQRLSPATFSGVFDRLRKLGSAHGLGLGHGGVPAPPLPAGARFEKHSFANEAGSRTYKLYVPSHYNGQALPLLVMLHGCTQSPDDFAAGTRMNDLAEEQSFLVAYPEQAQSANASKCWNWFNESHQQRGRGEPSLIAGITRQIMRDFPIEPGRVCVAGLSAGGATAVIMGMTYPDLYAGIGVHSGLACGAARDISSAFAAMRQGGAGPTGLKHRRGEKILPTIVFHGDGDRTVNSRNGDQIIAQSSTATYLRTTISHGKAPGGISYTRTIQTDDTGRSLLEQWVRSCTAPAMHGPAAARPDPTPTHAGPMPAAKWCASFFSTQLGRDDCLPRAHCQTSRRVACASEEYLRRHGVPQAQNDIRQHICVRHLLSTTVPMA